MAIMNTNTHEDQRVEKILKLNLQAQKNVVTYCSAVLEKSKQFHELKNKFDAIDIAYARYKQKLAARDADDGVDPLPSEGNVCCNVFADDDVTPPIVVSQVDSYVAYLTEVFLDGSPIFPVVSTPSNRQRAEQLETLLDDHAQVGGYVRQLLLFLRDGAKYNFSAIEADWTGVDQFSVLADYANGTGQKIGRKDKKFTRLKRLNVRNTLWDYTLPPGDVSENGDFAGYIERMTATRLKRHLNKLMKEKKAYNIDKAMACNGASITGWTPNYTEDPQISDYVTARPGVNNMGVDWENNGWFDDKQSRHKRVPKGSTYEVMRLYARIMPADYGISAPQPNTPQIWRFEVVNNQIMISAERIISAYDYLPILFGQPLEDGLGYQTQSIAEGEIPFQKAANTLFNIRFAASRRAVSDRALYIADMIKPTDINSPVAAPKIPVSISQLSQKKLGDAYMQIPFDMRGTETVIQDAATIVAFSKELHGQNGPRQGQFQKGNKSVKEWNDTMGGSEGRMRLPALTLEYQVFSPLKSMLALNIFQYGEDSVVTNQLTGKELDIKIDLLRKQTLAFKIADGYTPKSKLASTDVILAGMQMIGNSPILQQAYGARLPGMFTHFMSLSGVKGFEEYDPANQPAQQPEGLAANGLQGGQPVTPALPAPPMASPGGMSMPVNSQPVA